MADLLEFGLYKDSRGRRCWHVARNPGQEAVFIEGRRMLYVWHSTEDFLKLYTPYEPTEDRTTPPSWWEEYWDIRLITRNTHVRRNAGNWNGWYSMQINEKFYILSMKTIARHLRPLKPTSRMDRLIYSDWVV